MKLSAMFVAICFSLLFFLFPSSNVHAAENWVDLGYDSAVQTARKGGMNLEGMVTKSVKSQVSAYLDMGVGPILSDSLDPQYKKLIVQQSLLFGISNGLVAMMSNPPASTYAFVEDMGQTLGFLPKKTYAQGIGFSGLAPVLPIWKAFRNIAYLLLAVVMIVVGFMVMLRKKIDPKTVVTVQNALPRIVLTLILITFSYAIVGIMIDAMYLVLLVAFSVMNSQVTLPDPGFMAKSFGYASTKQVITEGGIFAVFNTLFPWGGFSLYDMAGTIIGYPQWFTILSGVAGAAGWFLPFVGPIVGAAGTLASAPPLILTFILSIALLVGVVRMFFLFLSAYVNIILGLIIGPIQLLTEAIPGGNGLSAWLKYLLSNIMVFPIAGILFMIAMLFQKLSGELSGNIWVPPYVALPSPNAQSISALFSMGVLLLVPQVVNSFRQKLKAEAPGGAGIGAIVSPLGAGAGQLMNLAYQAKFITAGTPHGKSDMTDTTPYGRTKKSMEGSIK